MACCADPKPRVLEANGRLFCESCHRYLDKQREAQPRLPETTPPDVVDMSEQEEVPQS